MRIALSLALCASLSLASEDLGLIHVDSTTIDDRFEARKTEVSNIAEISGEKVDNSHVENIQQVLQSVPGVTTEYSGGDTLKIHLRGIENQVYMGERPGVAIVIDGVPVFERTGKVNIDIDNIESIKVIKGGASYLFGDDALSGAVVITTKRGAKHANNYATIERGSFNYQKIVARTGYANDDFSMHIQASQRKGDGYWEDSDYDTKYANGKLQYYIDDTSDVTFGFEKSKRKKDSHGSVTGVTQAATNPESKDNGTGDGRDYVRHFDVDLTKLYATYAKDFYDNSNLLTSIYQYSDTTDFMSAPQKWTAAAVPVAVTDNDAYTTKNHYEQVQRGIKGEYRTASTDLATMTGLDLRANEYKNYSIYVLDHKSSGSAAAWNKAKLAGTVSSNNITDENVYAAYGEVKKAINEELTVTANARYDVLTYDFSDSIDNIERKTAFRVPSFRMGATYQLSDKTALYSNISSGFRTPTIQQMFSGDLNVYGAPTTNNPDLKPEQAYNYEIGIRGKRDWFDFDATMFMIERKDYILSTIGQYKSGSSGNPPASKYDNIGGVRNTGIELALNTDKQEPLFFTAAYSYIRAKFTQYENYYLYLESPTNTLTHYRLSGNTVPRVPKHQLNLTANYRANESLMFTGEMNAKSNYYADEMNQFVMPGYAEFNLLATYAKKFGDYNVQFFGRIDNVMDTQHFNVARANGDSNQDGSYNAEDISIVVNPGRVFTLGMSVTF